MHEEIMKRINDAILGQLESMGGLSEKLLNLTSVYAQMRQVELLAEIVDKLADIDLSIGMIIDGDDQ
jgi:hypothetical protein